MSVLFINFRELQLTADPLGAVAEMVIFVDVFLHVEAVISLMVAGEPQLVVALTEPLILLLQRFPPEKVPPFVEVLPPTVVVPSVPCTH